MRNRICSIEYMNSLMKLNLLCDVDAPPSNLDVLQWNQASGLWETTTTLTGITLVTPTIDSDWTWTGERIADWSDAPKQIDIGTGLNISDSGGGLWFDIDTNGEINFGNNTDNPAFNFGGTGLTTLGGNLLVNGGNIDIATGAGDLIQLSTGQVDVNGDLNVTGNILAPRITSPITCPTSLVINTLGTSHTLQIQGSTALFVDASTATGVLPAARTYSIGDFGNRWQMQGDAGNGNYFLQRQTGGTPYTTIFRVDKTTLQFDLNQNTTAPKIRIGDTTAPTYGLEVKNIVKTESGRIKNTTRVTTTYQILTSDHEVFCDTDGGAFTATLPATPVDGQNYRITNAGSNNLTIGRNSETIKGSATDATVPSGDTLILTWEPTEGWW